jgi:rare lipoprotein A
MAMLVPSIFSRYTPYLYTVLLVLFVTNCGIVREGAQITETRIETTQNRAQSTQSEGEDLGSRVFGIEEVETIKKPAPPTVTKAPSTNNPLSNKTNDYSNPQIITQNLPAGVAFIQTGIASWYGPDFQGRNTANGEIYNMNEMTAAHKSLPFDTQVIVENQTNRKRIQLRINDRGPYAKNRVIDLSRAGAEAIEIIGPGTAPVKIFVLDDGTGNVYPTMPHYTVQLGSYDNRAVAEQKSAQILSSYVAEVQVNGMTYYRVYFGDFENPVIAIEAMNRLKGLGHEGFIKQINK